MLKKLKDFLHSNKFTKLFYYSLHGIGTTIISLATYQLFLVMKMNYLLAFTISWLLANSYAYFSTRKIVFESTADTPNLIMKEYFEFMFGRFLTYIFNYIGLYIAVSVFKFHPFYSNVIISMIVIVLNYFVGTFIMKKSKRKKRKDSFFDLDEM